MKHLFLIALALVSLQATAQDNKKSDRKAKAETMRNMSAEDQAAIATKKLTLALDLNDDQQAKINTVMLEEATLRKQKRSEREDMKDAEKSEDAKIQAMKERLDREIMMNDKMKSILTAEQFEKWSSMKDKRKKRGKRKGDKNSKN
ncbi:MAG: hypothetical protein WA775_07715 [Psychroserpens sp.]|uniref:hypothetical protein n=1 Tax=Psychroserpens sp. TaxID=2020870 RepID=UPI003C72BF48